MVDFYSNFQNIDFIKYLNFNSEILDYINSNLTNSADLIDETLSVFHTSVPNIKLYYPEPFIATPTFVHDDIWFIHIVIYQYWLWFGFIYMIIFFFLAFLVTVRWCNLRHRPVRETRGVSRSKCGDLITATVPVSWAASIIIHESTDAIEFADGFGTAEMAVGIRAYQWGWEYYYPKDMDLKFYNNKSLLLGNNNYNFQGSSNIDLTNKFKNSLIVSDISDVSSLATSVLFKNDLSKNLLNVTNSDSIFGQNKLIARFVTNLISSKNLINLDNFIISNSNSLVNNYYWLNLWDSNILAKPDFNKYSTNFLSNFNSYLSHSYLSNYNDLKFYIKNFREVTTFKSNKLFSNIFNQKVNIFNFNLLDPQIQKLNLNFVYDIKINTQNLLDIKFNSVYKNLNILNQSELIFFNLYSDQDFKRWAAQEMIEDLKWSNFTENFNINRNNNLFYKLGISDLKNIQNFFIKDFFIKDFNLENEYRYIINFDWLNRSLFNSLFLFKFKIINNLTNYQYLFSSYLNNITQLDIFSLFSNNIDTNFSKKSNNYFQIFAYSFSNANNSIKNINTLFYFDNKDLSLIFKNFITYYQAFWKVFKSTLNEERSTFNYTNYSNTNFKLPLVMAKPSSLLSIIQKTQSDNQFFNPTFFIKSFYNSSADPYLKISNLNYYNVFSFPFMLSFESDLIRYSWFDWYSFKSLITAKAADTSVFNLNAVKQYEFAFTKDPKSELINKFDNYFTNYAFARRIYLPDYSYNPKFFNSHRQSIHINLFKNSIENQLSVLKVFNDILVIEDNIPQNIKNVSLMPIYFNYSTQLFNNHNFFNSYKHELNNFNLFDLFINISSKKSYLLKTYSIKTNYEDYINNNNLLWNELKLLTKSNIVKTETSLLNHIVNFNKKNLYNKQNSNTLKSQYIPLKKGIVNMIRIQADKAIAMPTDTRLQILAVSKDIIHSWSIPSAGIKIDCIPGYSSHRIAMFTVSGIYWGQCMEICGRFHHWMPIVVYFLRRDLFCLWCTHFIFNNKQLNSIYQGLDLRLTDSSNAISGEFNSWNYILK